MVLNRMLAFVGDVQNFLDFERIHSPSLMKRHDKFILQFVNKFNLA